MVGLVTFHGELVKVYFCNFNSFMEITSLCSIMGREK